MAPAPKDRVELPPSRQLVIDVPGVNPNTTTPSAMRDALKAQLPTHEYVHAFVLQRGYNYFTCFEGTCGSLTGN